MYDVLQDACALLPANDDEVYAVCTFKCIRAGDPQFKRSGSGPAPLRQRAFRHSATATDSVAEHDRAGTFGDDVEPSPLQQGSPLGPAIPIRCLRLATRLL